MGNAMSSASLNTWRTVAAAALDQIASAHAALGGTGPGRRFATEQVNHAYAVPLSSQFQRFCRDPHTEAADAVSATVAVPLQNVVRMQLLHNRQLDRGNASPDNIGSDFGRFDLKLWDRLVARAGRNHRRQSDLEALNRWWNAIAHQDFTSLPVRSGPLWLTSVRRPGMRPK